MRRKLIWKVGSALVALSTVQTLWAQDKTEGKKMYVTYCSGCHGESGKADGPAAKSLSVKPANHMDGAAMNQLSDKFLFDIISKGGSAVEKSPLMPAWSQLKEKQINEIISHIRSLAAPPYKDSKK